MSNNTTRNIDLIVQSSLAAFRVYKTANVSERVKIMHAVADEIEQLGDDLIDTAHRETHLPKARLMNEKGRTVFQWRSYADAVASGLVLDLRIDTALPARKPPRPDIRKMMAPIGPVTVFGASNFPFAFSTAGGDTASAIAAGNTVVIKAHPGHPGTSHIMADAIRKGIESAGYPADILLHVEGGIDVGVALTNHPSIKAVGFTGSFQGGKALFDIAAKRSEPIPVFAEMGSINPVFLLPGKLHEDVATIASQYIDSLTLGTGQFCTNPGVLIAVKGDGLEEFKKHAIEAIKEKPSGMMLHEGIAQHYDAATSVMSTHAAIEIIGRGKEGEAHSGQAMLALTSASDFQKNTDICGEVFGPFGMIVECESDAELLTVAKGMTGQLTITILGKEDELQAYADLVAIAGDKCGRLIFNNFPTGVEVCMGMHHGGPFPATTDSRFTSVGPDAIKRFLRPVTYQNWPDSALPDELKNSNPMQLFRTVNGDITKKPIENL